jgi:hypothetical protein
LVSESRRDVGALLIMDCSWGLHGALQNRKL